MEIYKESAMTYFLSRGILTTMSTKSVSFFLSQITARMSEHWDCGSYHEISISFHFSQQSAMTSGKDRPKTVQIEKHPNDMLGASHHIVLHDLRRNSFLMMPAQYVLDHGKIMNHIPIPLAPTLLLSLFEVLPCPKLQKHHRSRCWRVKWDWDVLLSKQPSNNLAEGQCRSKPSILFLLLGIIFSW